MSRADAQGCKASIDERRSAGCTTECQRYRNTRADLGGTGYESI